MTTGITKGDAYRQLFVAQPRPPQPEPDEGKLRLLAVEASLADARRALARARQLDSPFRRDISALEQLAADLSHDLLEEANR